MNENQEKIKRSEFWLLIYNIVSQIPRAKVNGDAMDHGSCASELERIFADRLDSLQAENERLSALAMTGEREIERMRVENERLNPQGCCK